RRAVLHPTRIVEATGMGQAVDGPRPAARCTNPFPRPGATGRPAGRRRLSMKDLDVPCRPAPAGQRDPLPPSDPVKKPITVPDLPYLSYQTGTRDAIRNAGRFLKEGGAAAVKIEGGRKRARLIRSLLDAEIPVMAHIGLTPQSVHLMGGYRVQGKRLDEARALVEDARALEEA